MLEHNTNQSCLVCANLHLKYVNKRLTMNESGIASESVDGICEFFCGGMGRFLQVVIHPRAPMSRLVEDIPGPRSWKWYLVTGSHKGSLGLSKSC